MFCVCWYTSVTVKETTKTFRLSRVLWKAKKCICEAAVHAAVSLQTGWKRQASLGRQIDPTVHLFAIQWHPVPISLPPVKGVSHVAHLGNGGEVEIGGCQRKWSLPNIPFCPLYQSLSPPNIPVSLPNIPLSRTNVPVSLLYPLSFIWVYQVLLLLCVLSFIFKGPITTRFMNKTYYETFLFSNFPPFSHHVIMRAAHWF